MIILLKLHNKKKELLQPYVKAEAIEGLGATIDAVIDAAVEGLEATIAAAIEAAIETVRPIEVEVADPTSLTTAEKKALWDKYEQGTILNVVLHTETDSTEAYFKVVSYGMASGELAIGYIDVTSTDIGSIVFENPYTEQQ